MDVSGNPLTQKLFHSFMRLRKLHWFGGGHGGHKPSDIRVLFCIKSEGQPDVRGKMVSEISNLLHVSPPTVTQLIKGLEADGLVERRMDATDRRVIRVKLTEAGEKEIQEAKKRLADTFNGLIAHLGEEQSEQLVTLLNEVFKYYNLRQSQPDGGDAK